MEAGKEAVEEATKVAQGNQIIAMKMDLADLATVKQFAAEFLSKFRRLDVLVNNAGVMACPLETTKDGFEKQFQTNHIGECTKFGRALVFPQWLPPVFLSSATGAQHADSQAVSLYPRFAATAP